MKFHIHCPHVVAILIMAILCACHSEQPNTPGTSPSPQAVQPPVQNINREIIIVMPPGEQVQDGPAAGSQHQAVRP
jgi:hypothetical protein